MRATLIFQSARVERRRTEASHRPDGMRRARIQDSVHTQVTQWALQRLDRQGTRWSGHASGEWLYSHEYIAS